MDIAHVWIGKLYPQPQIRQSSEQVIYHMTRFVHKLWIYTEIMQNGELAMVQVYML